MSHSRNNVIFISRFQVAKNKRKSFVAASRLSHPLSDLLKKLYFVQRSDSDACDVIVTSHRLIVVLESQTNYRCNRVYRLSSLHETWLDISNCYKIFVNQLCTH